MSTVSLSSSVPKKPAPLNNSFDIEYVTMTEHSNAGFVSKLTNKDVNLFTTDVTDLYEVYIKAMPVPLRKYYSCHDCKKFINKYGTLVVVDSDGKLSSPYWDTLHTYCEHKKAVKAVIKRLEEATITGVFYSKEKKWGVATSNKWSHLFITPPKHLVFKELALTAFQASAVKRENYNNVFNALKMYTVPLLKKAVSLLESEALYRSEKVVGPAKFLLELKEIFVNHPKVEASNLIWNKVASAPDGFCHPSSSVIGSLLDDLKKGFSISEVKASFDNKMNTYTYQRPQAAPAAGNIVQAEKLIEKMGLVESLRRRCAALVDLECLWKPLQMNRRKTTKCGAPGVFSGVVAKSSVPTTHPTHNSTKINITWTKFSTKVLPNLVKISALIPWRGNFVSYLTASNKRCKPLLPWDAPKKRNHNSVYMYINGSGSAQWALVAGEYVNVLAVVLPPYLNSTTDFSHFGKSVGFVLHGAHDINVRAVGLALFPETIRSDLHSVRATIEAYSKGNVLEETHKSIGALSFNEGAPIVVKVLDNANVETIYEIDRWE